MEGHEHGTREYRRLLIGLLCAGIATFAQLYSVQGVLPMIRQDLGITPAESALTVSAATLGIAVAVVPWSAVSDRVGRRRSMVVAIVAATVIALATTIAPSFPVLVALRFVEGGALGGIPAVAMAYIAEEVHPGHTVMAAASFISGNSLGGLSGRLVAAPVGEFFGWRGGVLGVTIMAIVATAVFIVVSPTQRRFVAKPIRVRDLSARLLGTLRDHRLLVLYLQAFLLMGSFVAMYNYIGFHLGREPFGISPGWVSLLFLAYLSGTWSSAAAGRLAVRHGRRRVLVGSSGLMVLAAALMLVPWMPTIIAALVLFTAGFFAAHSIANGWVPALAGESPAQASSFYILGYYAGSAILGYVAGLVYAALEWAGLMGFLACLVGLAVLGAWLWLPSGTVGVP